MVLDFCMKTSCAQLDWLFIFPKPDAYPAAADGESMFSVSQRLGPWEQAQHCST